MVMASQVASNAFVARCAAAEGYGPTLPCATLLSAYKGDKEFYIPKTAADFGI